MLIFLALTACQTLVPDTNAAPLAGPSPAGGAAVAPVPAGRATLRTCDLALPADVLRAGGLAVQTEREDRAGDVYRNVGGGAVGGVLGGGRLTTGYGSGGAASTGTRSAAPGAAPAAERKASAKAAPVAAPAPLYAMPDSVDFDGMSVAEGLQASAAEEAAPAPAAAKKERSRGELAGPTARAAAPRPSLDWGATVFLSNDDSMSLASAQRLLWAVQSGGRASADQIRPHELLNYFGFDTVAPAPGEVFGVSGSAARTADDTLTLAFAVEGVTPERQPLDMTVVLDRSGSMSAEGRMEYLKRGLRQLAGNLQRGDRVNLVLFDHEACNPLEGYVHGRDDARLLTGVVDALAPRGSTDLDLGVREGYRLARAQGVKGRNGRVLLISDALLNTGDVNPATVSEVARAYENDGVRLSAVGVGRDFNDKVLDMLTEKGKGAYVYLGSEAVVDRIFGAGFDSLVQTVAHDVHFSVDLPESLAMTRFYGEEASTVKADVQPIHYYAGTRQLFLQDVALRDGDVVRGDTVTFHVEYTDALTGRKAERSWSSTVGELLVADDHNLRKGRALMGWTDLQLARAMGGDACGAPFSTWQERAAAVQGDAELAWLDGITARQCGGRTVSSYTPPRRGVDFKVRVDSDIPIAEVAMSCAAVDQRAALTGGGNVARFANVAPGSCTVTLGGVVPMVAQVEVPVVGGQATCRVRGGRLGCS